MIRPNVPLAREIGRRLGADVILLARSESGQWAGASWGRTRERCGEVGRIMDRIFDENLYPPDDPLLSPPRDLLSPPKGGPR